jgi:heat shock protein HslJ
MSRRAVTLALLTAVGAVAIVSVAGCGGGSGGGAASPAATLEGHTWTLTAYWDGTKSVPVPASVSADAVFAGGTINGRAPVNSYSGPYKVSGSDGIAIGPIASTMMAGPAKAMKVETAYFAALEAAKSYGVSGDQLTLADDKGTTLLTFRSASTASLVGRVWEATGYNNGKQAVVSVEADSTITAEFTQPDTAGSPGASTASGTASGSSGINTYRGPCTIGQGTISIGELATTQMAGPEKLMQQEQLYLAALKTAATWSISGSTLELRTADGALAVSYVAK